MANPVHRRRVGGIHRSSAQAIEDEDHDIARMPPIGCVCSEKKVEETGQAAAAATSTTKNLFHRNSSKPKFKIWTKKLSCVDAMDSVAPASRRLLAFSSNPNTAGSAYVKAAKMPMQP